MDPIVFRAMHNSNYECDAAKDYCAKSPFYNTQNNFTILTTYSKKYECYITYAKPYMSRVLYNARVAVETYKTFCEAYVGHLAWSNFFSLNPVFIPVIEKKAFILVDTGRVIELETTLGDDYAE